MEKSPALLAKQKKFEERNKKAIDILDDMGAEVIITVCPSCYKVFKETAKNQKSDRILGSDEESDRYSGNSKRNRKRL